MDNEAFVNAAMREQEKLEMTQAQFAVHIDVSQGGLSKFYNRGVKDGITVKILRRFPHLAHFFAFGHSD